MTRLHTADPLVAAYTDLVTHIERLILAKVPAPFRRMARGLSVAERHDIATSLAWAARLAAQQETDR